VGLTSRLKLPPSLQTLQVKAQDRQHCDRRRKLQSGLKQMAQHEQRVMRALQLWAAAAFERESSQMRE